MILSNYLKMITIITMLLLYYCYVITICYCCLDYMITILLCFFLYLYNLGKPNIEIVNSVSKTGRVIKRATMVPTNDISKIEEKK
jgi:hypothetical protein